MSEYKIQRYTCRLVKEGPPLRVSCNEVSSHNDAEKFFRDLVDLPHEEFHVVYLSSMNIVLGRQMVSRGGRHGASITPADVYRGAIVANAAAIVVCHNHPSGDPTPSIDDVVTTKALKRASEILGIALLDHVVVSRGGSRSVHCD